MTTGAKAAAYCKSVRCGTPAAAARLFTEGDAKTEGSIMKTTLLMAASVLVLSAGIALAAPAITKSAATLRAGPGSQYQAVGRLPPRAAVDVAGCNSGWCEVAWNGADGFVSAGVLAMAGEPAPVAGADHDYSYDDTPDYLYATPDFYGPAYRHHHHRHWSGGNWQHNPPATAQPGAPRPGFAGPPIARGNPGVHMRGAPQMSAPVGMPTGGPRISAPHAAPAISAPHAAPAGRAAAPGITVRGQ
jgi:uncharacterized protein YraI